MLIRGTMQVEGKLITDDRAGETWIRGYGAVHGHYLCGNEKKKKKKSSRSRRWRKTSERTPSGACKHHGIWKRAERRHGKGSKAHTHEASHLLSQPPSVLVRHRHGRSTRFFLQTEERHQASIDGEQTQNGQTRRWQTWGET